jgi:hypothetical protein
MANPGEEAGIQLPEVDHRGKRAKSNTPEYYCLDDLTFGTFY